MAAYDTISPITSAPEIAPTSALLSPANDAPPNVISNDPITAARLIASIPVNLGQNINTSA